MEELTSSCRLCGRSENVKINLFSLKIGSRSYAKQIDEVFKVKVNSLKVTLNVLVIYKSLKMSNPLFPT